jgi:hypothetical protein
MKKLLITISLLFILFQSKSFSCGIRQGISFREPSKNNQIVIGKINISGPLLAFDLNGKIIPGFDKIPIKQKINYDYIEQNGILLVSHDEVYNFYDIKNNSMNGTLLTQFNTITVNFLLADRTVVDTCGCLIKQSICWFLCFDLLEQSVFDLIL